MAKSYDTQALLDQLLSGHQMTSAELDVLISNKVDEDIVLEYKDADVLKHETRAEKKKVNGLIRKYMSGFANSMGGILIIGVHEGGGDNDWYVTPCETHIRGDLAKWASDCLKEIAHYFSPPPRFFVIEHEDGNVLVVVTGRSLGLVPCKEKGGLVHYIRFHDKLLNNKTLGIPEYLLNDLVLGRRQHPHLNVKDVRFTSFRSTLSRNNKVLQFSMRFEIENESMAWANDVKMGLIGIMSPHNHAPLNNYILAYVDVLANETPFLIDNPNYQVNHIFFQKPHKETDLTPFSKLTFNSGNIIIPVLVNGTIVDYTWKATVYLIARDVPPVWYQIELNLSERIRRMPDSIDNIEINKLINDELEVSRVTGGRAVVEWANFQTRQ